MSIQKLHYENLGGILIRREGLLTWRCPLCKAEGQSPEVMRTCPECGSKDATLPGAQPAPSVPELIESLRCACNYIDKLGGDSQQYRAMIAAATEAK